MVGSSRSQRLDETVVVAAAVLLAVLSTSISLSARSGLPSQRPDADSRNAAAITLVVRVTDDEGRPVRGLGAGDFVIRIGDRIARVRSIRELTPRARRPPGDRGVDAGEVVSNDLGVDANSIVAVVLVDDVLVEPHPENLSRVRRLLEDFGRAFGPNGVVAVTTSSRSHLAYDFRRGAVDLVMHARSVVEELLPGDSLPKAVPSTVNAIRSLTAVRNAITALALGDLPGHRVLVHVSQGAPTEPWQPLPNDAARQEFDQAAAALARTVTMARDTGVVVHAVDPRELGDSVLKPYGHLMLHALADGSGAIAHLEPSRLRSVAHRVVEDSRAAYEIRLAEPGTAANTERLAVRTTRPGDLVRTVRGHGGRDRVGARGGSDLLTSAVQRGLLFSGVPLHGLLRVIGPVGDGTVRAHLITAVRQPGTDGGSLATTATTFQWAAVDSRGEVVTSGDRPVTALPDGSLQWSGALNLPWDATRVIVGCKMGDGRLGTLQLKLSLPPPDADVMVGGVGFATSADDVPPGALDAVTDDLTYSIEVGRPVYVVAPISWRGVQPGQVSVAVVIRRNDEVVARIPRFLDADDREDGYYRAALFESLSDLQLVSGRYEIDVEARLRSGPVHTQTARLTLR